MLVTILRSRTMGRCNNLLVSAKQGRQGNTVWWEMLRRIRAQIIYDNKHGSVNDDIRLIFHRLSAKNNFN